MKNGDTIVFDAARREITLGISKAEMDRRLRLWKQPKPRYTRGVLAKYAATVKCASDGAVTDAGLAV